MNNRLVLLSFILFALPAFSQDNSIQQKNGLIQNKEDQYIAFRHFDKFAPVSVDGIISEYTNLIIHDDQIFVLDRRQSKILVFDIKANYLYTIGRPGQGPGDLEHPSDIFITDQNLIYVLNPMAKRIEVFSTKGEFLRRIELLLPKEIYYSYPSGILVSNNQEILVTYKLSQHLIDVYDKNGVFLNTLLKREDEVIIPGDNIGNCSYFQFFPQEQAILHFNYFTGLFTKISKMGVVEKRFSAFDTLQNNEVDKITTELLAKRKSSTPTRISTQEFQLWSKFSIDDEQNVIVYLLLKKKSEKQKMYVYSPIGDLLYVTYPPPFIENAYVADSYYYQEKYIFRTPNDEIYITQKEKKNK